MWHCHLKERQFTGIEAREEQLSWVRCPCGHLRVWAMLGLLFVPIPSLRFWRSPFRPRPGSSVLPSLLSSSSSSLYLGEVGHLWSWLPSCQWRHWGRLGEHPRGCDRGREGPVSDLCSLGMEWEKRSIQSLFFQTKACFLPPHSLAPPIARC